MDRSACTFIPLKAKSFTYFTYIKFHFVRNRELSLLPSEWPVSECFIGKQSMFIVGVTQYIQKHCVGEFNRSQDWTSVTTAPDRLKAE
jgi:hypothetical protein